MQTLLSLLGPSSDVGEFDILRSCISLGLVKNIEWRGLGWLLEEAVEHSDGLGGGFETKGGGIGKGAVVSLQRVDRQITTGKDGIRVSLHLKRSMGWTCGVLHGRQEWRDVVGIDGWDGCEVASLGERGSKWKDECPKSFGCAHPRRGRRQVSQYYKV
jgi:hypothetical protein